MTSSRLRVVPILANLVGHKFKTQPKKLTNYKKKNTKIGATVRSIIFQRMENG